MDSSLTESVRRVVVAWERHRAGAYPKSVMDEQAVEAVETISPGFFITLKRAVSAERDLSQARRYLDAAVKAYQTAEAGLCGFGFADGSAIDTALRDYDEFKELHANAQRDHDIAQLALALWDREARIAVARLVRRMRRIEKKYAGGR